MYNIRRRIINFQNQENSNSKEHGNYTMLFLFSLNILYKNVFNFLLFPDIGNNVQLNEYLMS